MRSWLAKRIILLNGRDLVSCASEMHAQAVLQLDEERGDGHGRRHYHYEVRDQRQSR